MSNQIQKRNFITKFTTCCTSVIMAIQTIACLKNLTNAPSSSKTVINDKQTTILIPIHNKTQNTTRKLKKKEAFSVTFFLRIFPQNNPSMRTAKNIRHWEAARTKKPKPYRNSAFHYSAFSIQKNNPHSLSLLKIFFLMGKISTQSSGIYRAAYTIFRFAQELWVTQTTKTVQKITDLKIL